MSIGRCGILHRHVAEVLNIGSSLARDMGGIDCGGVRLSARSMFACKLMI